MSKRPAHPSRTRDYRLEVAERRITRTDHGVSLQLELGDESERGLFARARAVRETGRIDVLLRHVHGRIRCYGTIAPLLERLRGHRPRGSSR